MKQINGLPHEAFGNRLKQAMKRAGWSAKDLAHQLEVRVPTVSEWRSGKFAPEGQRMEQLADLLGVTARWLQQGDAPLMVREGASFYESVRHDLGYWLGRLEEAGDVLEDAALRHRKIRRDLGVLLGREATDTTPDEAAQEVTAAYLQDQAKRESSRKREPAPDEESPPDQQQRANG